MLSDGIHTVPLKMTLTPWVFESRHVFYEAVSNPLALSHFYKLIYENKDFNSIEQFLLYRLCVFHGDQIRATQVRTSPLFTARNVIGQIQVHNSWFPVLEKLILWCIQKKCTEHESFRESVLKHEDKTIIYADKHPLLGSRLNYKLTVLTKTKHFPGQNKLGELFEELLK